MRVRSVSNATSVTEVGFGAAQFGNLFRETTEAEAEGAFEAAWAGGIRYFDTAPHYGLGLSERRLGRLLQGRSRDDFALSTKVGRLIVDNPAGAGQQDDEGFAVPATSRREWDFSADGVRRSLDASLERLGLDRIDIVYLHDPDDFGEQALAEAIPALIELRDQGMIGAVGAGMNQSQLLARFVQESDIDVVMLAGRYTLLEQPALADLLPLALERGVSVVAAGVYNSGLLAGARPRNGAMYNYEPAPPELLARTNAIADVCERHGVTLPEAAIAFPLLHPAVVSVVMGLRTEAQAQETLARFEALVPDALWSDLVGEGLLAAEALTAATLPAETLPAAAAPAETLTALPDRRTPTA
ncbi:aldo/keto reductase [Subtercola boreus]|uniref:Aldo/keto reductase n=1 Tax=Subtercola boreus TaxID=120213 RepID=A0A3E0VMW3_9MICO|nr:aldo/keto reductase [Subtercola boreus]RFA10810.1 aldo/keto reductase [Subtercola boreus]TQL55614.1 D-threo-aldose 1-dehydrogenase [Subtercola boreus]